MKKIIFITVLAFLLGYSCYYDNVQDLYPSGYYCDTNSVTYSDIIAPVIQRHCIQCHSNSDASSLGGNIRLQTYSQVIITVRNRTFAGSVNYKNQYQPMPPSYRLDECLISQINTWIQNGYPEN